MKLNNTFKKIIGANNYVAGIFGEIWNIKTNKIIKCASNGWAGYRQCQISFDNGTRICKTVHRLVYEAFNGPIKNGLVVNHIDEDKDNNSLTNLELLTRGDNIRYGNRSKRQSESRKNGTGLRKLYDKKKMNSVSDATKAKHREMTKKYWADRKEFA